MGSFFNTASLLPRGHWGDFLPAPESRDSMALLYFQPKCAKHLTKQLLLLVT